MAYSDFFLGRYSVISEIWSSIQISELIRSSMSCTIHYFVTADHVTIASYTALILTANVLCLQIICTYDFSLEKCL